MLIPETLQLPGFDNRFGFSTPHQWFTCVQLLKSHMTRSLPRLFPTRSPPRLFTVAAVGCLIPAPYRRYRGACPHHLQSSKVSLLLSSWHTGAQRKNCPTAALCYALPDICTQLDYRVPGSEVLLLLSQRLKDCGLINILFWQSYVIKRLLQLIYGRRVRNRLL